MPFERRSAIYGAARRPAEQEIEIDVGRPEAGEFEFSPEDQDEIFGDADYEMDGQGGLRLVEGMELAPAPVLDWNSNLATFMDDQELRILADDLIQAYEADEQSRAPWLKNYTKSLDLLGLKVDERTDPWDGAAGVYHPLLAEAITRYVSEAILETYPPVGPAETSVLGVENSDNMKRAARVKAEMNFQCTKKMPEDRSELELTMWRQGLAGVCFRKCYYDQVLKRPRRIMVPAEDFVISYGASDLWTAPRYTHKFEERLNDIKRKIAVGIYRDYDMVVGGVPTSNEAEDKTDELMGVERPSFYDDEEFDMLEMYVDLDLELFTPPGADGVAVAYIVTIDKTTGTIVSIYRNHTQENPFVKRRTNFVAWKYLPGFGIYGTGLCQLLGGTADSATSLLRQLIDAGTISNIPAGFKSRALRIKGDDKPLAPGELRDVDLPPGMVRNSIEWLPTKDPSPVFVTLLQEIVNEGRKIGSVSDMKIGDSSQGSPVGTTLALIERHMRVISAVQARNNVSMAEELDILKDIIANDMPPDYEYSQDEPASRQEDFLATNIIPVADPSATTMSQRIMRYTAAEQIASRQPHLYDMARLHRQMFEQLQLPNADKIVPLQDDFVPQDPVTENMRIMRMQPVKAFINQDHTAHLAAHMNAIQDPLMQQVIGQSPNAAAIQAAAAAHIQEHVAYEYRDKMQKHLGFALPDPEQPLPPDIEASMSRMISEASGKLLGESQMLAAAQKAAEEAQDPLIQLRRLEVELKKREIELEYATDQDKIKLEREIAHLKAKVELAKINADKEQTGFTTAVAAASKRAEIASREKIAAEKPKPEKKS